MSEWNPYMRDRPKKFIEEAIRLFNERNGKTIIEIGCMRMKINHPIEENHHDCCCDGHSSLLFARTGAVFFSCDIDQRAVSLAREYTKGYPNTNILFKDGIKFLRNFGKPVDLFFIDGWDVDLPNCAEMHAKAYEAAKKKLHKNSVVIIDDTDVDIVDGKLMPVPIELSGGKGRLLVPLMVKDGWKIKMRGRCTILIQ